MVKITVSERNSNNMSIAYIYNSMTRYLNICKADADISFDDTRTNLIMTAEKRFLSYLRKFTEECIADVIAIGYKYDVFKNNIYTSGLYGADREVLLCALVSADFDEDKRYITGKLKDIKKYSIDGFFNFRLKALREKWSGIIDCIPKCFNDRDLSDFLNYILVERKKAVVHYKDCEIYDNDYNKLKRSDLLGNAFDKFSLIRELILSCATEIVCHTNPSPELANVMKKYYSGRVTFNKW